MFLDLSSLLSFTANYGRSFGEQLIRQMPTHPFERDLRRVNLERFPYHFLFRIVGERVRVLVVRHHKRRPSLGLRRR